MTGRSGLGRGLGALIPSGANALEELATTVVVPNPGQPRQIFDDDTIGDLAASIRQVGILQPIVVRPLGDGTYQIVVGERRWRAARRAGLTMIPALVIETDERGSLERALIENVHRQDLNPLEEAAAYQQLVEEAGLTHEELAERLGLSRPAVTNALRLLDLPSPIQRLIVERRLSAGHGRALLGLGTHPLLERVAQRVAAEQMSVRQTEELVRSYRVDAPKVPAAPSRHKPALLEEMGEVLSEALETRVRVQMGKRKGWVVIEAGSRTDLHRICDELLRRGNASLASPEGPLDSVRIGAPTADPADPGGAAPTGGRSGAGDAEGAEGDGFGDQDPPFSGDPFEDPSPPY